MTINANRTDASGLVHGVLCQSLFSVAVAGDTRLIWLVLKPVSATGSVAGDAVQITFFNAGVHLPPGVGVIFASVAAIRIKVRVFQCCQIEMIVIGFAGDIAFRNWAPFGVAGATG